MPKTIEVPISLIKAGDLDAIRELLPETGLFGRWAEHPELGRGIIVSVCLTTGESVDFVYKDGDAASGTAWDFVRLDSLTLDPVELTTFEDFENAPVGTIVSDSLTNAYQKVFDNQWESLNDLLTDKNMASTEPWTILRYGWGE